MAKRPTLVAPSTVLDILRQKNKPLRPKDLYGLLGADAKMKKSIKASLGTLVDSGQLVQVHKSYAVPEALPQAQGVLDIRRSGVGYVLAENKNQADIFIHPSNFGGAWPGDTVAVIMVAGQKKDSPEGRVVRIIKRATTELVVRVSRRIGADRYLCQPTDSRMPFVTEVETTGLGTLEKGDLLAVTPVQERSPGLWLCTATAWLGAERNLATQEQVVKIGHDIATAFSTAVEREALAFPADPGPADWAGREDLRDLPLVTIDGESAKDFDDAVYVERLDQGFRLVVAIADVAHYVPEGSALDLEARERGNSYYFPLSVEPMLPHALSDGLCSLRPHVPRLALVVDAVYAPDGSPRTSRCVSAVIRSAARLTYPQVQAALDGQTDQTTATLLPMLSAAADLARLFMRQRAQRHCLDFDLPEVRIFLQDGQVCIEPGARLLSHRLIEEFMIATNERVAEFLGARQRALPYRVHPDPDPKKLDALLDSLRHTSLGHELPKDLDQAGLRQLVDTAQGSGLEYLVSRLILRTMMQAQYSPENSGHYGLASANYCHFTSPIRRYADLLVHRCLKRVLAGVAETQTVETLQRICEEINASERKAMDAEREIQKRAAILALEDRVGEVMPGVISGLADFGFWVELIDIPVDGLVRLATLDEYYVFDFARQELMGQRSGTIFSLGQRLDVQLESASLERVEINFTVPGK